MSFMITQEQIMNALKHVEGSRITQKYCRVKHG